MEGQEEWVTPDGESVADVREGYAELEKPEPLGRRRRSWPGVGSPKHLSTAAPSPVQQILGGGQEDPGRAPQPQGEASGPFPGREKFPKGG